MSIKKFWMASIKRQLILGIAFVHMIMMSFFIFDLVEKEKDFLNTQHTKKAISLTKVLANNSTVWLLSNDFAGLQEVIESIKHYPGIEYILITNKRGQVLAHTNENLVGKYLSDKRSIQSLKSKNRSKIIYENNNFIDVSSPITNNKQLFGWARIALNKNEINEGLYKVRTDGIVYTALAVFLGTIFAFFMAASMTKSLYKIIDTIKKSKSTNDNHRVNLHRVDEIGTLSKEFDSMLDTIQEQNQLINSVIDSTPDLIFFKNYQDKDGLYIGCNNAFCKFVGKTKDEIVGKNDFELFDKKTALFFRKKDKVILEKKQSLKNEEWVTYPDNSKVLLDTIKAPLYDRKNELLGVLGFSRNITQKYEVQKELDKKNIIIYQQSKQASLGEMIGNIAHQWRQPLSTISTLASGIKLQKEFGTLEDEQLNKELDNIVLTTKYLSKTIDDFRNFLLQGKSEKELINMDDLLAQFKNLILPALNNNFIELIIRSEKNIKVYAITNELIQSLLNIVNNARDALKELKTEEKLVFIDIKTLDNSKVEIKILDNGGGIDKSVINRIFEPYFTTKHRSVGTGIGLYMVFQIITKSLDGSIKVSNKNFEYNSVNYKGAEFKIILPTNATK